MPPPRRLRPLEDYASEAIREARGSTLHVSFTESLREALSDDRASLQSKAEAFAKTYGSVSGPGLEAFLRYLKDLPKP